MFQNVLQSGLQASTMSTGSLDDFGLGMVDCPECGNTGTIVEKVILPSGYIDILTHECQCMKKRRSLRTMNRAGLSGVIDLYTFDRYSDADQKCSRVKEAAKRFVEEKDGWFYIGGQSGSGKTHICTAISWELVQKGTELFYMLWRDHAAKLKAGRNDREWFESEMRKLKDVPLLYIDDFWKGAVTDADIGLAFEILNARYNRPHLRTVISSELPIEQILSIDEAVGGRIVERARGFIVKAPDTNFRLKRG